MSLFEALSGSPADENIEKRNSPAVAIFEEMLRVFGVFPRNWATDLNLGKPRVMLKKRKILGSFGVMPHKLWGSAYFACYCNICWGVPLAGRPPTGEPPSGGSTVCNAESVWWFWQVIFKLVSIQYLSLFSKKLSALRVTTVSPTLSLCVK